MSSRHLHPDSPWLLVLLAALVALGPLSIDMYLPAMPVMKVALATDISQVQLTMSSYLTGFALFHLVCGPLSDRYGRRPILLAGTGLFVLACLGCALSSSIEELLLFRFVQGIGACVGPTIARAMVRDVFAPTHAARALSLIAMLMALAPAIAPLLGGLALTVFPWPSIFLFLGVYGVVMMVLISSYLAESLPERQSLRPAVIAANFGRLARSGGYMAAVMIVCLLYAGMMTYVAASSFVFIDMYGVPPQYFGLVFLTAVLGYMTGSGLSARFSFVYPPARIIMAGVIASVGAGLLSLAGLLLLPNSVLALAIPMGLNITALGLVMPNAMVIALQPFPNIAGTASALLGFLQMALAAIATAMVGLLLRDSPLPMLMSVLAGSCLALPLAWYVFTRHKAVAH